MRGFSVAVASLALLVAALARPAFAQDEGDVAAARVLGQEGVVAAKAGRCEEAVDKLNRAKRLFGAPTLLVPLGECEITLGKIVAGTENLQIVARMTLPPDASAPFIDAQTRARSLLPDAVKKLAHMTIVVDAPAGITLTVTDNDQPVNSLVIGVESPADPGHHVIAATAPGFLKATKEVDVDSGQKASVTLKLEPDPNAPKPEEPQKGGVPSKPEKAEKQPTPPAPEPRGPRGLLVGGAVTAGVGGAALVIGAIFGGLAAKDKSKLNGECPLGSGGQRLCPKSGQSDIDQLRTDSNVATGMFVVGGVAAGVGLALIIVDAASHSGREATRAGIEPLVGPGFVGMRGRF